MKIQGEKVICSNCGSKDMRVVAGVVAECRKCGLGMLIREFDQWKDKSINYDRCANSRDA